MILRPCSREQYWQHCPEAEPFAKTFDSKARLLDKWGQVQGAWSQGGVLLGAALTTVSKQGWGNLQLLHVFSCHQGKGVGSVLLANSLRQAWEQGARYWRVSSEKKAEAFYAKNGLIFAGRQKSGCLLCVARLEEGRLVYDWQDPTIQKAIYKKGKGGCVEVFVQ